MNEAKRRIARERREERRRASRGRRSCFWTWPWGHLWTPSHVLIAAYECATPGCDAMRFVP